MCPFRRSPRRRTPLSTADDNYEAEGVVLGLRLSQKSLPLGETATLEGPQRALSNCIRKGLEGSAELASVLLKHHVEVYRLSIPFFQSLMCTVMDDSLSTRRNSLSVLVNCHAG